MKQAWMLRERLTRIGRPAALWGDGAFDCEAWHEANWDRWGVPSYAPTNVRSADGAVNGFYRSMFVEPMPGYGRRWMCESVNSAIKRTMGSTLRARKDNTLFAEAALKVAAYAIKV